VSSIYSKRPDRSFSFPLGKYAKVLQIEIYTILECSYGNIRRAYRYKLILILSDSQAALKAFSSPKVISGLFERCLDAVTTLASCNEVTLVWVSGHCGIPSNEEADKIARQGAAT
jgi:hypothetical protein